MYEPEREQIQAEGRTQIGSLLVESIAHDCEYVEASRKCTIQNVCGWKCKFFWLRTHTHKYII